MTLLESLESALSPTVVSGLIHLALDFMSPTVVSGLIQLAISLGGAGLVVQLLLLRQNRRRIAGQATANEANAASTLSGAALKMVENAQRAQQKAEDERDREHAKLQEADFLDDRKNDDLNRLRWRIRHLTMYLAILQAALRSAGVNVPPEPDYQEYSDAPPPERPIERPGPSTHPTF